MSYHAVRHVRSFIKRSMGLAGRGNSGKDVEEHTMRVARALRSSMTDVEQTAALVGTLLAWLTGPVVEGVFTDAALDVARYRENRLAISKVPSEKGKCDYCHSWRQGSHKRIEHLLADSRKFFSSIADDFFTDFDKSSADDTTIDDLDNTENPDYLCAWVQFISDVSHAEKYRDKVTAEQLLNIEAGQALFVGDLEKILARGDGDKFSPFAYPNGGSGMADQLCRERGDDQIFIVGPHGDSIP